MKEVDTMYKVIEVLRTYSNGNKKVIAEVECSRCSGHGRLEQYRSVDNGLCFKCNGLGIEKKEITIQPNESYEMIQETTTIKPFKKDNYEEIRMRNAMIRINNERKEKWNAIQRIKEEDKKLKEEMEEEFEPFTWD